MLIPRKRKKLRNPFNLVTFIGIGMAFGICGDEDYFKEIKEYTI
jgi:hypothetical protein